jgi:hypothetical protein
LADLVAASTGVLAIKAQATITLAAMTSTATGALQIKGQAAISLADLTVSATGAGVLTGQAAITLGDLIVAAAGNGPGVVQTARGDDAFRSYDARAKLWTRKAEEWLASRIEEVAAVAEKPRKQRKRFIADFMRQTHELAPEWSIKQDDFAARVIEELKPAEIDMAALHNAVEAYQAAMLARRRKRDNEALIVLVTW